MRKLRIGLILAGCLLLPSTALAAVTKAPDGQRLSLMLRHGIKGPGGGGGAKGGSSVLVAHGGPVLKAEAPYVIYWTAGHAISPTGTASETLLNDYLGDVAAASAAKSTTNVYSVLAQYMAPYSQTFSATTSKAKGQTLIDTDAYPGTNCSLAAGMTACVSDASIQAELTKLINAGTLPQTGTVGSGTNPIFFVVTPVDVNVCTSTSQCVNNSFCAYHSYFVTNKQDVLYASVPFSVFATSTKGCQTDQYSTYNTPVGPSGDEAYNVADDLSHELSETITDPLINAWYSHSGYEIGDLCEAYGSTADTSKGLSPLAYAPAAFTSTGGIYDQIINGHEYYNQTEYSNSAGQCMTGVTPY